MAARGEVWNARLNLDRDDVAVELRLASSASGPPQTRELNRGGLMAERNGYALVITRDIYNNHPNRTTVTVVPRTTRGGSTDGPRPPRPLLGGVVSPRGDGGCTKRAEIDCLQVITVFRVGAADRPDRSQLLKPIASGRTVSSQTINECAQRLHSYLNTNVFTRWLWSELLWLQPPRRIPLRCGQLVAVRTGASTSKLCVVISNTLLTKHRPLDHVTVVPTIMTAAPPTSGAVELDPVSDRVPSVCWVETEAPMTICTAIHIVRESLQPRRTISRRNLARILQAVQIHLGLA